MNTRSVIKVLLLFVLLLPAHAAAAGLGELRLSLIEGDVQIRTEDTSEWNPAVINFPLRDGDQLWVPEDGRAEVETRRGTTIRLDERTALDILTVDNDALQFYLDIGLAYVNASGERGTTLQIDTPLSSIRVYKRAKFSVDVVNNGDTDVSVYLGKVSVESRKGETLVRSGKMLSLGRHWADLSPLGRADAWEQWNIDRDKTIEGRRRSARYLPEELAGYSSDFDNNGEWVEVPSYGYVWRPTVLIGVNWSPYRHGRWVWIGNDYVWIARESWGWAPYHYGRWSFVARHGWFWVPPARNEVYWGPGYVGWVHTATYVAWVPLAPREVYYGRGYYGSNSVDITHVDINKVSVNIVYKNVYVDNSVTTVHNDTFIRGRQVDFKVRENPFLKENINVGRPQIEPERATRIPSMREIPQDKAPPARIRETSVKDLKKERRLVTKKDKSVFVPETAPPAMEVEQKKDPRTKAPRKERLTEGDSNTISPQKREVAQPVPAERKMSPEPTPPPESRQERRQGEAKDKESTRDAGGSRTNRKATQSGGPEEEVQAAPAERESPPESRQERRQGEAKDKESTRDAGGSRTNRKATQSGDPEEEVQAAPAERESPPESRQERRQGEAKDKESTRDAGGSRTNRKSTQSGGPEEEVQAAPAEQESPPESRQERRQGEAKDKESTRDADGSRTNRKATRPPVSKEEARTTPAATEKGTEAERPTLTPEQQKKVKKKQSSKTEKLSPEEIKNLSPEELEKLSPEELEKLSPEEIKEIQSRKYKK